MVWDPPCDYVFEAFDALVAEPVSLINNLFEVLEFFDAIDHLSEFLVVHPAVVQMDPIYEFLEELEGGRQSAAVLQAQIVVGKTEGLVVDVGEDW